MTYTVNEAVPHIANFEFKAYIVSDDFLKSYMLDDTIAIEGQEIEAKFVEERLSYYIYLYKGDLNGYNILGIFNQIDTKKSYKTCAVTTIAKIQNAKTLIAPYKYHNYTIQGMNKKVFMLEETCEGCDVFEISIGEGILQKEHKNYYIQYSIELDNDYPTYTNGSEIVFIEESNEYGFKRHVVSIDSTQYGKIILFSVYLEAKEGYELKEEDSISLMIKYKTVKSKEELIQYEFNPKLSAKKERYNEKITAEFVKNIPSSINSLVFIISSYKDLFESVDDLRTINQYNDGQTEKQETNTKELFFSSKYTKEYFRSENYIINLIVKFEIPETGEEIYYSYDPVYLSETPIILPNEIQNSFNYTVIAQDIIT